MPRRVDPEQAVARMRAAGAEPLEPFRAVDTPWRCRCLTCDAVITPRLSAIGRHGPCSVCARRRTGASRRLDPDQAERVMRAAGFEPLADYPGSGRPWLCRCLACEREVSPKYDNVKAGYGCRHCAATARGIAQRGIPTALRRAHGGGQEPARKGLDPDVAAAELRAAGFEPLTDYPGQISAPWPARCMVCDTEGRPRLHDIRTKGSGCRTCRNRAASAKVLAAKASAAVAVMRAAGFEPLTDYPGSAKPWRCRCTHCGEVSTPRHYNVRSIGSGCRHCWPTRLRREPPPVLDD